MAVPTPKSHLTPPKPPSSSTVGIRAGLMASPAYSTNLRKHSLYGTEDRIVIDPGSRLWKIGFSNIQTPRKVFSTSSALPASDEFAHTSGSVWGLDLWEMGAGFDDNELVEEEGDVAEGVARGEKAKARIRGRRRRVDELLKARLTHLLRSVFYKHLLTESRSRKLIILENPLLPHRIKELLVEVLFDNLKVPSISFIPTQTLALLALGRTTGLVIDIGWLETTVIPVSSTRPLYSSILSTPLAGQSFLTRLKDLITEFGTWQPPPPAVSLPYSGSEIKGEGIGVGKRGSLDPPGTGTVTPSEGQVDSGKVPDGLLSWEVLEDLRLRGCFIGPSPPSSPTSSPPPSPAARTDFLQSLHTQHAPTSSAKDGIYPLPYGEKGGVGRLTVPGWVRERCGEVWFGAEEGGEGGGLVEVVLGCLMKVPIDLRAEMISNILIIGGGGMLPGFIPRLKTEVLSTLSQNTPSVPSSPSSAPQLAPSSPSKRVSGPDTSTTISPLHSSTLPLSPVSPTAYQRSLHQQSIASARGKGTRPFAALSGLGGRLRVLNDPETGEGVRWTAGLMAWVGGSLAGAAQISGEEITREQYDEYQASAAEEAAAKSTAPHEVGEGDTAETEADPLEKDRRKGFRGTRDWARTLAVY